MIINESGTFAVRMVNTNSELKTIKCPTFKVIDLEKFNIYTTMREKVENERTEKVQEILKKAYPNDEKIKPKLENLCSEFSDIFALETDRMTVNNFYEQTFKIKDNEQVYIKNYRTAHSHKQEIEKQVNKLIQNELIETSTANYNSPVILVPKKGSGLEKKWRLCIDYRQVNKKLVPDEILDNLGRAKFFSVIDLYSGFHQVPLTKESREITTFTTDQGSFQWKILPFGLNVSPNSFSRMMNIAFSGLPPDRAFFYIEDIIIIGKSEEDHLKNLRRRNIEKENQFSKY